jgi:hypothetical protein
MQREALEKLNRDANEMTTQTAATVPETEASGSVVIQVDGRERGKSFRINLRARSSGG